MKDLQIIFRFFIAALLTGITLLSCSSESATGNDDPSQKTNDILVDSMASTGTIALFKNLAELAGQNVLFGHQDDTAYGVNWWAQPDRSDVKAVCGDYPAVYGWDLGGIHNTKNLDGVDFEYMKMLIREAYARGGINTISMHLDNPKTGGDAWDNTPAVSSILPGGPHHQKYLSTIDLIAAFLKDLKSGGEAIPVIFRPYHEHNHNWPWWGRSACPVEEYNALWRMTIDYLTGDHDIHHLLFAISPQEIGSEADYLARYPGDNFVDILGLDDYRLYNKANIEKLGKSLSITATLAESRGKIAALTEVGLDQIPIDDWWTAYLLPAIQYNAQSRKIAWALVWRNFSVNHHFAPYPGHNSASDFVKFFNHPLTLFQSDLPAMYTGE